MSTDSSDRAVAIVGLGATLPDAPNAPAFRDNVWSGATASSTCPPSAGTPTPTSTRIRLAPDKTYSKIGSWVRGFEFDWKRFKIPPKVAEAMDEGQQWAVTIAAEALADYGWPERPLDTERTAVILGNAMAGEHHYLTTLRIQFPECARWLNEAQEFLDLPADVREKILSSWHERMDATLPPVTEDTMPGELANILSGRVANVLNLRGPNFVTDAACASSFAALDAAVDTLVAGHCDVAITGGIDRNMGVNSFVKFCKIGALSATGTRPFGDGADGFVMGEGSAVFVLKRLADAERDGDRVYAVVRGVGGSSDGKGKGITAPNPIGQVLAVQRAWENAGLDPATAGLIEAHGTSTRVGDVVEVESLSKVFGGAKQGSIALGSAKSNIGHLKAGAGAAGLLKAVYAVHEKVLPPTLNARTPNPGIDFASSPLAPNHELREWTTADGTARACGVSAYGFGGTNFHIVLEEHVPGALTKRDRPAQVSVPGPGGSNGGGETVSSGGSSRKTPLRGIAMIGALSVDGLKKKVDALLELAQDGRIPPVAPPDPLDLREPERIAIDFGDEKELVDRLKKAQKGLATDAPATWKAFQAQGIFRGSGPAPGKVAFLFTGQGSQYVNMGRDLAAAEPVVEDVFQEADRVLERILGRPLTSYLYVDGKDRDALRQAEDDLKQTAITQPAVLSMDTAMSRLLGEYGIEPDMVMGHSLGEYGALVSAGVLTFAEALEAAAARGREMSKVSLGDNGAMAAVMGPIEFIKEVLEEIDGYVVPANLNARGQSVIGGETAAVEAAVEAFQKKGYQAQRLPVSHAFHTKIVAPAAGPLGEVLARFDIKAPRRPLVGNVEADFYPSDPAAIRDLLCRQIASPVRWVEGLEKLYEAGVRAFVEVGPKRALKGFVDDVLGDKPDITSLYTNRPRPKEIAAFNQALCGLYAAGYGAHDDGPEAASVSVPPAPEVRRESNQASDAGPAGSGSPASLDAIRGLLAEALKDFSPGDRGRYDRNDSPQGSVVISGTGLGLPGVNKPLMDPRNAERILSGEQFVELIPEQQRRLMAQKRVTRLVKSADGGGHFELIDDTKDVIKLAGRAGSFDLAAEYGVSEKLVEALDTTTQLAMAAGIDALREAGIPLVQTYRKTTTGKYLPERWVLPEPLRNETGVIFASAFPGFDRFADETRRYYTYESRVTQRQTLEDLRQVTRDPEALKEIQRRSRRAGRADLAGPLRVRPAVPLPHPSHGAQPVRGVRRGPGTQHPRQRRLRRHRPGHRPGRGLDPHRPLPPGARGRGRQRLERQPDGVDRVRLPRHRRRRHRRQGRGGRAALRPASPRDPPRNGGLRPRRGEPGRGGGARDAGDRGAPLHRDREQRLPRHPPRRRAHRRGGGEPGGLRRASLRNQPDGHGARDGLHLPRDLHPRPRRQRRRGGDRASQGVRAGRQPDRGLQHQGLHRTPHGRRHRGRDRGEDPRARDRAPGAELQGAGPRARLPDALPGREIPRPVRDPPGRRLRVPDRAHAHPPHPRGPRPGGRRRGPGPLAVGRERVRPAPDGGRPAHPARRGDRRARPRPGAEPLAVWPRPGEAHPHARARSFGSAVQHRSRRRTPLPRPPRRPPHHP